MAGFKVFLYNCRFANLIPHNKQLKSNGLNQLHHLFRSIFRGSLLKHTIWSGFSELPNIIV